LPDAQSASLLQAHPGSAAGGAEHWVTPQVGQQLPPPTTPPGRHMSAECLVLHREPQSTSVVHVTAGSSVHVPVVVSQVLVGTVQVMKPLLPQVERAAQRVTLPLQFVGSSPQVERSLIRWATQLT